MTIAAPQ